MALALLAAAHAGGARQPPDAPGSHGGASHLAPLALPLAQLYGEEVDPAHYWVSEKLDGVRAFWDGRTLRFRSGDTIRAPAWFVAGLPPVALDGELWMGRGAFDRLSGIVRKHQPVDHEGRALRFMVFELPGAPGTFTERIARMRAVVAAAGVPWLEVVPQRRVSDRAALNREFERVLRAGGEGLMLHRADAPWLTGRSPALLKMKPWRDAEARVVAHLAGRGKYRGMLGALEVESPEGRRFRIGSGFTDAQRRAPPALGALVTYRYRALTASGLPRFASFVRERDLP
jgi:DNA ligase-1